eukprot:scaffold897_cov402-Prasinococcus_capsulatus_cf.AAC.57
MAPTGRRQQASNHSHQVQAGGAGPQLRSPRRGEPQRSCFLGSPPRNRGEPPLPSVYRVGLAARGRVGTPPAQHCTDDHLLCCVLQHNFLEGRVLREVSLLPAMVRVAVGRRPVALAAGHIDPPPAPPAPIWAREQVIVVVTESWNLMCFNSALTLLWEVSLQQFFPEGSHQREIALLVTNHTMKADGSRGTVFVGGSMNTVHKYQEETADEMLADDQQRESKVHGNAHGDKERLRNHKPRKEDRHFMYFAFAASSGHMMWRHTAKDFHKSDVDLRDQLIPQHNYRLDAASLEGQRVGEVSCRDYAESMMHALPHQWSSRGDTRFELLHFKKHKHHRKRDRAAAKASGIEQGNNKISDTLARTAKVVGDTAMGHNRNKHHHNLPEHLRNPNAIVAHLQDGIEVIHMYSGRPICFLSLEPDTLHADINRDGVVDHLRSYGNSESAQHYHTERHGHDAPYACSGVVTSGVHHEMLFNVSVCRSKFGMDSHMPSRAFGRTADGMSPLEVAAPVPVPHSGHVSSAADVVFLNSRGEVTLVDQHGTKKWQHSMGCHWSNPRLPNGAVASHVIPSLQPLRAHKNSHVSAILSVGESKAAVVALHGSRLQTLKLPSAPAAKAVIADFTGTHDGYYAFAQQRHAGAVGLQHENAGLSFKTAKYHLCGVLPLHKYDFFIRSRRSCLSCERAK